MASLAHMVCAAAGYQPAIEAKPSMPSGVAYRVADPTRLNGFCPPKVSLEEGTIRALATRDVPEGAIRG
jgi:hypothetical protein